MNGFLKPLLVCLIASGVAAAPSAGVFLVGTPQTANTAVSPGEFELLGGYDPARSGASRWREGSALQTTNVNYTLWNLYGRAGAVRSSDKTSYGPPCPDTYGVTVNPAPSRADWWIAVSAPWNPRPRAVTVLPNASQTYVAVVRDFLVGKGLKNPSVRLDRVVRTDLDGDGRDEIIIAATRFKEGTGLFPPARGAAGDYGLLLVRKIIAGRVQTLVLGVDVFLSATTEAEVSNGTQNNPDTYALVNVLDLNGDGKMEIVMFNAIYEDYGVFVMEWDGKKFQQRVASGCGA